MRVAEASRHKKHTRKSANIANKNKEINRIIKLNSDL